MWELQHVTLPCSHHDRSEAALNPPLHCALQRDRCPQPALELRPVFRRKLRLVSCIPVTVGRDHPSVPELPLVGAPQLCSRSAPSSEKTLSSGTAVPPRAVSCGRDTASTAITQGPLGSWPGWLDIGRLALRRGWGPGGPGTGLGLACNRANGPVEPLTCFFS